MDLYLSGVHMSGSVISVRNLEMRYGDTLIQKDLTFDVRRGEVFVIMGGSGCGKSTLLKHMIGLNRPYAGSIHFGETDLWGGGEEARSQILRNIGVLYQQGALWSSLTLGENVMVPLEEYTDLGLKDRRELAAMKLALVGLAGFEDHYPSEISGGMRKRAGLARAMALDPEILFFDEPSAGLDPVSAKRLDDLILELRSALGSTIVIVTHELASIFAIGSDAVFLDAGSKTMLATGNPLALRDHSPIPQIREFLSRGESPESDSGPKEKTV
jgi:phospholipid/cholesterol/gamma-HCH transport system ATP-binding protein